MELDEALKRSDLEEWQLNKLTDNIILGWKRASERHAEQYYEQFQAEGRPINEIDLRFLRHLDIRLDFTFEPGESQPSPYYLFGKPPFEAPIEVRWATAEDWLAALESPAAIAAIRQFKMYPINARCAYRNLTPREEATIFWPETGRARIINVSRQGQVL